MSLLRCKALRIDINFLVLWSIFLNSSLVQFKKGPECLLRETDQVFIPLIRCLRQSLVSRSFLVLLRYYYLFSFLCHLVDDIRFKRSYFFLIGKFYPFRCFFASFFFSLEARHIFNPEFFSYILVKKIDSFC